MEPRAWTTVDKTGWGPGPWDEEPDKVHWVDAATDLDCLMVRNRHSGNWCGYVAVTEGHPLFGVDYQEAPSFDVHGGLTYANFCMEGDDESVGVCHVPLPGRPDHVWWFGFDCAHSCDLRPAAEMRDRAHGWPSMGGTYRDRSYVEGEVRSLAKQLAGGSDD